MKLLLEKPLSHCTQLQSALSGLGSLEVVENLKCWDWNTQTETKNTGKTATNQEANDAIGYIRGILAEKYGSDVAENVFIQYGGSMNEKNASDLLSMPQIDGGLIGGASLVPEKFQAIGLT